MKAVLIALLLAVTGALPAADKNAGPTRADMVRWLIAHQDDLRDIPFPEVVMAATGKRIIPVNRRRDAALLRKLGVALDATLAALNEPAHPIHLAGRVNEASHYIEDEIRKQVNLLPGWKCTIPLTSEGNEMRSGYPDLRVVTDKGVVMYLDPKLYEAGSRGSSLRTFYYEPRTLTGKIHDDALQMLVGIEHSGSSASTMHLMKWELIDVSKLRVSLKAEFQAGNDNIYRPRMIVGQSAK
jgi:hypothetical protein